VIAPAQTAAAAHEAVIGEQDSTTDALHTQLHRYALAIESILEGVCCFSEDQRLIFCNRRYAEIYRLSPEAVRPGMTLVETVARCIAAGTAPTPPDEFLARCDAVNAGTAPNAWIASLADRRRIEIHHRTMPGGGWISTHEDVTEASRTLANERITLQTLVDWVPDNLWIKDVESRFVIANEATARRMGKQSAGELIGKSDLELCPPETAQQYFADERRVIRSGQPMIDKEEYVVGAHGEKTWILTTKVPLRNDQGEIVGLAGVSRDISDRRRADLLRSGQARILENIAVGAPLETLLDNLVRFVEMQIPGTCSAILLADNDGTQLRRGAGPNVAASFVKAMDGMRISPKSPSSGAAVHLRKPVMVADMLNDPQWADYRELVAEHAYRSCWSVPIISPAGKPLGALTVYSETTRLPTKEELEAVEAAGHIAGIAIERQLIEERIRVMATHDALTGLPNRVLLMDRLAQTILQAKRTGGRVTAIFIDLDNFKLVNDSLGHGAGDTLLKVVAERMIDRVRASDTVARLGGDEFVILLVDQVESPAATTVVLEDIRAAIAEPVPIEGQMFRVTSSFGVATYPGDGADAETLLLNADVAMYEAKEKGRDNFQFYTKGMNEASRERRLLQEGLRGALANNEFSLVYQPQVELHTSHIFAVEALLRWHHPILGEVPPSKFIPLAEQSGLIITLGDWVLHEACRQNKNWQDAGMAPVSVCVNVSARQFRERDWVQKVSDTLRETDLEPKYLELELTESMLMNDVPHAIATMRELQALGVHFAIDDFGTGYSSLSALKSFPVARLKIDQSFVRDLPYDANERSIATAVISLGQKLNMKVIAEGVENDEQLAFLRDNQCDEIQGYHFSEPVDANAVAEMLSRQTEGAQKLSATARPSWT